VFYYYQAQWSGRPVVHLNGRRYPDRAYDVNDVEIYSNAPSVRLRAGARDLGAAKCADDLCVWHNVRLEPGETVLTASAGNVTDSMVWGYSGKPDVINIRAGSPAGLQIGDHRFGSDNFVTGGTAIDRHPQPGPDNPYPAIPAVGEGDRAALFETYREGQFTYAVPVAPGRYRVTLRFFEPKGGTAAGQRVFDVSAGGKVMAKGLDPVSLAGGALKPAETSFTVAVKKGGLTLDFKPTEGQAIVSAIEIEPEPQMN
jgi:beta-galactosidase